MIPLDQCKNGFIYQLNSRNLAYGVFSKKAQGFIGIREKFGNTFLDVEYHYDTGAPFGTAKALLEVKQLPQGLVPVCSTGTFDRDTGRPVEFDLPKSQDGVGWYFTDNCEASDEIRPVANENKPLYEYLMKDREA